MPKYCALLLLISAVSTITLSAEECCVAGKREVVARVNGKDLAREDFNHRVSARMFQARNTYYEAERKALEEIIDELLLEQRAREENVTIPELLKKHVDSKIAADPPEDALRVYYEGLNISESFEAVRDRIVTHLRDRRIAAVKTAYMQSLRDAAKPEITLAAPRIQVPVNNMPIRGNATAPVKIIEFADYECPYCQQIQPVLDKLADSYKGKVSFAYKDVPLPMHPDAQKAAEAKHCSAAQGKYWEYHDLLVSTKRYKKADLVSNAQRLQLNLESFEKCLDSGEQASVVADHMREAQALGLQGTPSFFINGRFFSGVLTYEKLREIVDEELRSADSTPKQSAMR